MCWRYQSNWVIVSALTAVMLLSGCATTKTPSWEKTSYGTWKFSSAEVKKLPSISIRNILSSASEKGSVKVQVLVRAQNLDGIGEVKQIAGPEDVIITDAYGQEVKIKIAEITEIQTIRKLMIIPRQKSAGETAAETAELLSYVPLIPVAIVSWPFLRVLGLDEVKNEADRGKASLAYKGMSKGELITYIGEPKEKYYCETEYGPEEIWIYKKSQVLRGGRDLFIHVDNGLVYHTSEDSFFKHSKSYTCSVMTK